MTGPIGGAFVLFLMKLLSSASFSSHLNNKLTVLCGQASRSRRHRRDNGVIPCPARLNAQRYQMSLRRPTIILTGFAA
jgi:hypothetical protein